jgi:hypothetical protein
MRERALSKTDWLIPYFLGFVFIAAGLFKIVDPAAFAISIARLRLVPLALVGPLAILLPWIELVAGLALFIPRLQIAASRLTLALLIGFSAIVGIATLRGTAAACGCFGSSDSLWNKPEVTFVRNIPLIALCFQWRRWMRREPSAPEAPASPA